MKWFVYRTEKIDNYRNNAGTVDYDYSRDFEEIKKIRGYAFESFYVTDTPDYKPGDVFFACNSGDLHKVIKTSAVFEDDRLGGVHIENEE